VVLHHDFKGDFGYGRYDNPLHLVQINQMALQTLTELGAAYGGALIAVEAEGQTRVG
jgi:hypothetical protein